MNTNHGLCFSECFLTVLNIKEQELKTSVKWKRRNASKKIIGSFDPTFGGTTYNWVNIEIFTIQN